VQRTGTVFSFASFEVREGNRMLLCSDGVSDVVTDDGVAGTLREDDVARCAEDLASFALESGSRDNVTCVVAEAIDASTAGNRAPAFVGAFFAASSEG
jgi:protein phosphatase